MATKSSHATAKSPSSRRRFSDEFRRDAVQMLLDGHAAADVAQRLGLSGPGLLYRWKAQHLRQSGPVATALDDRGHERCTKTLSLHENSSIWPQSNRCSTMKRFLQPFWLLLTTSTDQDLRRMVEYLKEENRILRSKLPDRLIVTDRERLRLLKYGTKLGRAIREVITIVAYRTFCRWRADVEPKDPPGRKKSQRKPGRPRTAEEIRELVIRIASENNWGSARTMNELKKLRIRIGRTTVRNILREAGIDPGPKRGQGSWDEFVRRHAATLWASDFLSVKSMTMTGVVDLYLLFFIHIGSRCVFVSPATVNPDSRWVTQQARNMSMQMEDWGLTAEMLIIDHDTKFTKEFDAVLETNGTEIKRVGPVSPNMNAYAERYVQTLRQECLDHFVVCGEKHLNHIVKEFVTHYHEERPHSARGGVPLTVAVELDRKVDDGTTDNAMSTTDDPTILKFPPGKVKCRERLGGLLKHYYRDAA